MAKHFDLEFAQYVGSALREVRKTKGKTLDEVATDTGIAKGYLSRIERGQHVPSMEKLSGLADYYRVPLSHFLLKESRDEVGTLNLQKELWAARYLAFDGETIELTKEFIEHLETAIRMGVALAQKTQETKGKGP